MSSEEDGPVCPDCGTKNRPMTLYCKACHHSFLVPRTTPAPPTRPDQLTPWEQGVRVATQRKGLSQRFGGHHRPDHPLAMVGAVLAVGVFILDALPGPLQIIRLDPVSLLVVGLVAVVLGLQGAGFQGYGIPAIVVGGLMAGSAAFSLALIGTSRPTLAAPVPPPEGFGLRPVSQPVSPGMHVYTSTTLLGDEAGAKAAVPAVLAYYRDRLEPPDWIAVSFTDDSLEYTKRGSNQLLYISAYEGLIPDDRGNEIATLILQIQSVRCPDECPSG
jgi:hypothetical protein